MEFDINLVPISPIRNNRAKDDGGYDNRPKETKHNDSESSECESSENEDESVELSDDIEESSGSSENESESGSEEERWDDVKRVEFDSGLAESGSISESESESESTLESWVEPNDFNDYGCEFGEQESNFSYRDTFYNNITILDDEEFDNLLNRNKILQNPVSAMAFERYFHLNYLPSLFQQQRITFSLRVKDSIETVFRLIKDNLYNPRFMLDPDDPWVLAPVLINKNENTMGHYVIFLISRSMVYIHDPLHLDFMPCYCKLYVYIQHML